MKNYYILFLASVILSCQKDEIFDTIEEQIEAETRTTLSERYSDINETTSYFNDQKGFTGYHSKQFTWDILSVPYDGHTHYHTAHKNSAVLDINNDGKQDIVAFATSFCNDHIYSYHEGKLLVLLDYKNNSIPEIYNSSNRAGSGGFEVNDYNNDGKLDVLMFSTETKMNMWDVQEDVGGHTDYPPSKPLLLTYDNGLNQTYVGLATDSHAGASGDIDNDGDIDFVQISVPSIYNGESADLLPSVSLNNGNGTFISKDLFTDLGSRELSTTAVDLFDLNQDGYLDLILGWRIGIPKWYEVHPQYWQGLKGPLVFFGNGSGTFSFSNSIELSESYFTSRNMSADILGFGFTDYDLDGDIDILLTCTRNEPGSNFENKLYYDTYYVLMLENNSNNFSDVSESVLGSVTDINQQWPAFYALRTVDIDNDGDIDIIPDWFGNWGEYNYSTNLKWVKQNKTFFKNN